MDYKNYESEDHEESTKLLSDLKLAERKIERIKEDLEKMGYKGKSRNKDYKKIFAAKLGGVVVVGIALLAIFSTLLQSKEGVSAAGNNDQPGNGGSSAQYALYDSSNSDNSGGSSGGSGGGCCGGSAAASNPADLKKIEAAALDFYTAKYGDKDVTVKSENFGCHIQCNIYKDGKLVKELSYRNNQFSEI